MALEITEVRVRPYDRSNDKLKAFATITFNNCFIVTDLKVIRGKKGLFVAMPSRKRKDGQFKDVAHPLNTETRQMIEDKVLSEYEKALESGIASAASGEEDLPNDLENELKET